MNSDLSLIENTYQFSLDVILSESLILELLRSKPKSHRSEIDFALKESLVGKPDKEKITERALFNLEKHRLIGQCSGSNGYYKIWG
jgi:hypothetical protein